MPNTTNLALPYPALSSAPNVPQDIQNLAAALDTAVPPVPFWCRKPSDLSRTNNTASADPDLLMTLPIGNYWLTGCILYSADSAVDMKCGLYGPTGSVYYGFLRGPNSAVSANPTTILIDPPGINTTPATAGYVIGGVGTGQSLTVEIGGLLTITTAGPVGWSWAENTTSATATTVKAGSSLVAFKLP